MLLGFLDVSGKLLDIHALFVLFAGEVDEIAETGGVAARVDHDDLPLGILFPQLLNGDHAGVVGAAQTGGDTRIENILARLEVLLKVGLERLKVDLRGLGISALADNFIEFIQLHHAAVGVVEIALVLNLKLHWKHSYTDFVNLLLGEVAGSVSHKNIIHSVDLRFKIIWLYCSKSTRKSQ